MTGKANYPMLMRLCALLVVLASGLATGCGDGKSSLLQAKADAASTADVFVGPDIGAPDPAPVTQSVGTTGGTVEHTSGASLKVPAGALPANVELTMQAAAPPASVEAAGTPLGAALQLGPEGQTFLVPVQIAVPIDPASVEGIDPKELQVVLAPAGSSDFVGLETTYDPANHVLLAETSHFSIAVPVKRKGLPLELQLPSPMPPAKAGEAYGPVALKVAGGKAPYTWSLTGGQLPPGLALAPDGVLSGTPEQAGSFAPALRVKDSGGQVLEKALALSVDGPPNPVPVIATLTPGGGQVGSADLPVVAAGQGFAVGALVTVGGKGLPTLRTNATELQFKLPAALLAQAGVLQIAAVNPAPGGGAGGAVDFAVTIPDSDVVVADVADAGADASDDADADAVLPGDVSADDAADGADGPDVAVDTAEDASASDVDPGADASPTCVPATEICDGQDNDCNGQTDENPCSDGVICTFGDACNGNGCGAGAKADCEDGNPCTWDKCDPAKGCVHELASASCSDNNVCTEGEACQAGVCTGGTLKTCGDGDACTADQCNPTTGTCDNTAVAGCGDPCSSAKDCQDDGNPCTAAGCQAGKCALIAVKTTCDDGNACTSSDTCADLACTGAVVGCDDKNPCTDDTCSASQGCVHSPKASGPCEDGDACTVADQCAAGTCKAGIALNCDDGSPCTADACDPKLGCTTTPSTAACDDNNPCTASDACLEGKCAGTATDCSDGDACTADTCNPSDGSCQHATFAGCGDPCSDAKDCKDDADPCLEPSCTGGKCAILQGTASCDDGDACTVADGCQAGVCLGTSVTTCVDDNPCTDDGCDPKAGCTFTANAAPCSDGKACSQGDTCSAKACSAGSESLCNDGNPCTVDSCSEIDGCSHLPAEGACDDGNECTVGEACNNATCQGGVAKDCSDGNPCTLDGCDASTGKCAVTPIVGCGDPCQAASDCKDDGNPCTKAECAGNFCAVLPSDGNCDDGNPCSSGDTCTAGQCTGSVATCDDGNTCTADACASDGSCSHTPQSGGCEDGNACTVLEACSKGFCVPGGSANCDDGNACTDDACEPTSGCQHTDSKTPCSDDDPCSIGDACKGGKCTATGPKDCSDSDNCTLDSCSPSDGSCVQAPIAGCGDFCNTPSDCKDDGNPCTTWDCPAGKCAVLYPTSPCDDTNACTGKDLCGNGACEGSPVVCDDSNPCSDDSCDPKTGCVFLANTATCTDGQVCTLGDNCQGKACVSGSAPDCDDLNPCTFDVCDAAKGCTHKAEGLACSDGNPCTAGDACVGSVCIAGAPKVCDDGQNCTSDGCDAATGKCNFAAILGCGAPCAQDGDCNSNAGACLTLSCSAGTCSASDAAGPCSDGNACTSQDGCSGGKCQGILIDCSDNNPCTADTCGKGGCAHSVLVGACEDGDLCSVQDECDTSGNCKAGPVQQCSDGNPCTVDGCDPKTGCQFAAVQTACSDGDPCTVGDTCAKGSCQAGDPKACDDSNSCTVDSCDATTGQCTSELLTGCGDMCQVASECQDDGNPCTTAVCVSGTCGVKVVSGACDDGNACTVGDTCASNLCKGTALSCDDGNPCSTDSCTPKAGCAHAANTDPCSLGNACSQNDQCKAMVCTAGSAVVCEDGNACTLDGCDPDAGCTHTATTTPCDDGNPCSVQDECGDGACIGGTLLPCNDGNPCTSDSCDGAKGGCVFTDLLGCGQACATTSDCPGDGNPCTQAVCAAKKCVIAFVEQGCDDGDPCSAGDTCSDGVCGGTADACDDDNPCTADACLGSKGCSHTAKSGPCDDGSACTTGDSCDKGVCKGPKLLNCDDGNGCTVDACDPVIGCTSVASKASCTDNNPCTVGDACASGQCQPGAVMACDDGVPCTLDVCNAGKGKCQSTAFKGCGDPCSTASDCADDGDPCTQTLCTSGACALALTATGCDDGNACTAADSCDNGLCIGAPKGCDDQNACTLDSCDSQKGCIATPITGSCDDGNACTAGETCSDGACSGGKAIVCSDANPCTDNSCSPTKGCVMLANSATCDDDDQCTVGDTCKSEYCLGTGDKECDDGNVCTSDGCSTVAGCIHLNNTSACDDGDACSASDTCAGGKCKAGKAATCDDGSVCTTDSCDPKAGCVFTAAVGPCDDGDNCTEGDLCVFGKCLSGQPKTCDDNNPCTDDGCDPKTSCTGTANSDDCDDGSACTVGDKCASGTCGAGTAVSCDDKNPCTDDSCDKALGCKQTVNQKPCSDGDACTTSDTCLQGVCVGGAAPDCDDKNPCTSNSCDHNKGCVMAALVAPCDDGSACTTGDACKDGDCIPGNKVDCSDNNVCTDDSCDKAQGCVNTANTATCTDDNVCTDSDGCKGGACLPGAATDCNDSNPCTSDNCDKVKGCANLPNTATCSDGDACTNQDGCAGGKCATKPVNCDDGNACTFDACDPASGCDHANTVGPCSDSDACTAPDLCGGGNCASGAAVDCDDKNPCTTDSCDKQNGCVHANNTAACDDGSVCTLGDSCTAGACKPTANQDCDDKNPCTIDTCDPISGCANANSTAGCDDGDACTSGEACSDGACLGGKPTACDDKNPCTDDSCDKTKGCQHTNNTAACDDGDKCTAADKCAAGSCSGTTVSCDDSNACTDDSCSKTSGCSNVANSATTCNDGNACTSGDACSQGKCSGSAVTCNDNVACTVDSCVPATGCKYAPNNNLCNDNESCTTESCDAVLGCKVTTALDNSGCTSTDPCVTTPVCLSGKCSQKPMVTQINLNKAAVDGYGNGSAIIAMESHYPDGKGRVFRVDSDLNTMWEWNFNSNSAQDLERIEGIYWGNYFDGGVLALANVGGSGDMSITRLNEGNGQVVWSKSGFGSSAKIVMTESGMVTADRAGDGSNFYYADQQGNKQGVTKLSGTVWSMVRVGYDGVFVGGEKMNPAGTKKIPWYARVNGNGGLYWERTFAETVNSDGTAWAVGPNYTVAAADYGTTAQVLFLSVKNTNGDILTKNSILPPGAVGIELQSMGWDSATVVGASKPSGSQPWTSWVARVSGGQLTWSKFLPIGSRANFVAFSDITVVGGVAGNGGYLARLNADGTVGVPTCTATNLCAGKTCNDNVACTIDTCNPSTGCVYTPDPSQCDDGDLCTANTCDAVKGCTFAASTAACDDKNPCTDDTCDPIKGCTNTANAAPCEDGNACTLGDTCGAKACVGGPAKDCEDGIACTAHSCDSKTGCKQTANNAKCDDGKQCTTDTCDLAQGCLYAADAKVCDDANLCTDDSCDNAAGCSHAANAALCNDGNACTVADACKAGTCKSGAALTCDDNKECTVDSCDPASGCKAANRSNGASCTPSTSCSTAATCDGNGSCNDGPSKYWSAGVNSWSGYSPNHTAVALPADGGGPVYVINHGVGNYSSFARQTEQGQTAFSVDISQRSLNGVRCSPWAPSECVVFGRDDATQEVVVERRKTSDGSSVLKYQLSLGGTPAEATDVAFENGGNTQIVANRGPGGNRDTYYAWWLGWQPQGGSSVVLAGSGEDIGTGILFDKSGALIVGYTNSQGGAGYNGFWVRPGGSVQTFDSGADDYFDSVVQFGGAIWAVGRTTLGGGTPKVLAVRIEGGSVTSKVYDTLALGPDVGAVTYGANLFVGTGFPYKQIAAIDTNMNIAWQQTYPVPANAIAVGAAGIVAGGSQNSSFYLLRASPDGLLNCTDKNPCSGLQANGCDDKVACTTDACDVQKGCLHGTSDALCDDGNPCTKNACDAVKGCVYTQDTGVPCNDNNPCTLDTCDIGAGKCVFTADPLKACDDGKPCTSDGCDKQTGCTHSAISCDDGKVCTSEFCDPVKGCQITPLDGQPCDDGNACTVYDSCAVGLPDQGKCIAIANVCQQAVAPVLHTHAGVSSSIVQSGGKISAWYDVKTSGGFANLAASQPVIAKGAVFGRDGIDLASSNLRYGWSNSGSWTAAFVFRNGAAQQTSKLFSLGAQLWRGMYVDGKLLLIYKNTTIASVTLGSGKSYVLLVRAGLGEGKLLAFAGGAPEVSSGVVTDFAAGQFELDLNKRNSNDADSNATFGEVLLYDKALSDAELTTLATQLQKQWGLTGCQANADCDDANPCTNDFCTQYPDKPKECTHDALNILVAGACQDNNPCTIEEQCVSGQCVGSKPAPCNDNNPCTKDTCDPNLGCGAVSDDTLKCPDGNACTYEFCSGGKCSVGAMTCDDKNPCTDDSCNPASGCVFGANTAACDDGNPCTSSDKCGAGSCAGAANTLPCNDYNPCTVEEKCSGGSCSDSKPVVCPDDGNACTIEACSYWGGCKVASIKTCSDANLCTDDLCDPVSGNCQFNANAIPCSDGEVCTAGDRCAEKKCMPGPQLACNDTDICTVDACTPGVGCTHVLTTQCDDGNPCTVSDLCVFGSCLSGAPPDCDDGNSCTIDYCDDASGCAHKNAADGAACDDGELCTLPDTCAAGACKSGAKACDYAVTSLGDGEYTDQFTGKVFPNAGTLRAALFAAEADQFSASQKGQVAGSRTIRFFLGGKVALTKLLPVVTFDKVIDGGGATVLLDGGGTSRILFSLASNLTLKGLKFQNGNAQTAAGDTVLGYELNGRGASVAVLTYGNVPARKLNLENCEFYNGKSAIGGGAIFASGAEVTMTGGSVIKCTRDTAAGSQLSSGAWKYTDGGGAVRIEGAGSKFTATGVRFDYNMGTGLGSALWCGPGSTCDVQRTSFFGNVGSSGAVAVDATSKTTLTNVTIAGNEGYDIGAGLFSSGTLKIVHVTVSANSVLDDQNVPAVYLNGPTTVVNSILGEAGGTGAGLDCVAGPQGSVKWIASLLGKTKAMKGAWGPDGAGLICANVPHQVAHLKGPKLVGNVRILLPYADSPAVDKADILTCLSPQVGGVDATGAVRPQGNGCDMGSAELPVP